MRRRPPVGLTPPQSQAQPREGAALESPLCGGSPTAEDIEGLVVEIGLASERWLSRQGFAGEAEDSAEDEDDAQGVLQLASLSRTVATGERAGKHVRKVVALGGKECALGPRCSAWSGCAAPFSGRRWRWARSRGWTTGGLGSA